MDWELGTGLELGTGDWELERWNWEQEIVDWELVATGNQRLATGDWELATGDLELFENVCHSYLSIDWCVKVCLLARHDIHSESVLTCDAVLFVN